MTGSFASMSACDPLGELVPPRRGDDDAQVRRFGRTQRAQASLGHTIVGV
jgi:hypothetical protein